MAESRWYTNLDLKSHIMKNELASFLKLYKLVKTDIRRLHAELSRDTSEPRKSASCYRSLLRAFDSPSATRSMEAARLMLAVSDPELLCALKRRYAIKDDGHNVEIKRKTSKAMPMPTGRLEVSGNVVHTVFAEASTVPTRNGANERKQQSGCPVPKKRKCQTREVEETISRSKPLSCDENTSHKYIKQSKDCKGERPGGSKLKSADDGSTILHTTVTHVPQGTDATCGNLQENESDRRMEDESVVITTPKLTKELSKILTEEWIGECSPMKKPQSHLEGRSNSFQSKNGSLSELSSQIIHEMDITNQNGAPYLKTGESCNFLSTGYKKLGRNDELLKSPFAAARSMPQMSTSKVNISTLAKNPCLRPPSVPGSLESSDSTDVGPTAFGNIIISLRNGPGGSSLSDGMNYSTNHLNQSCRGDSRVSNPRASLDQTYHVIQSSLPMISLSEVSEKPKAVSMLTMNSVQSREMLRLPKAVYDDFYVVRHHRRSCFADGNSLVEVRPRSLPSAPTLIVTQDARGKFSIPMDIGSNRRAVMSINAMRKANISG